MAVQSSVIRSTDYQPFRRELTIQFVSGEVYRYEEVPRDVHRAFMAAPSKGRFFSDHIRDRYTFQRLTSS